MKLIFMLLVFQMPQTILIDPLQFTLDDQIQIFLNIYRKCIKSDTCILWTRGCNSKGYSQQRIKMPNGQQKLLLAHRLIYAFMNGIKIGGQNQHNLEISHLCHKKRCLNVEHLNLEHSE